MVSKLLVIGMLALVGATVSNAQPRGGQRPQNGPRGERPDAAQMAARRADEMKKTLNLSDAQYEAVKACLQEEFEAREKQMKQDREQMKQDRARRGEQEKLAREEQEKKMKEILTEEQFKTWSEEQKKMRDGGRRGPGGPGGPRPERRR